MISSGARVMRPSWGVWQITSRSGRTTVSRANSMSLSKSAWQARQGSRASASSWKNPALSCWCLKAGAGLMA